MPLSNGCQAGCLRLTGDEVRHHKDCQYYPDSLSEEIDRLQSNERHHKDLWIAVTNFLHAVDTVDQKMFLKSVKSLKILVNYPDGDF